MKRITSVNNNLVRRVHALQQSTRRRIQENLMVVEGQRLVSELLASGLPVDALFFNSRFIASDQYPQFANLKQYDSWEVDDAPFNKMADTETPQGVLAVCPIPEITIKDSAPYLYLVADQIRDPGNLGTMLRTAWAAGVNAVFLLPGTIDHTNPKVIRAGMGSHFHLPVYKMEWNAVLEITRQTTLWLADADNGLPYDEVNWQQNATLIIGGEAFGAGDQASCVAKPVHIPMGPMAESLNAAIACGIILFEAVRQRRSLSV